MGTPPSPQTLSIRDPAQEGGGQGRALGISYPWSAPSSSCFEFPAEALTGVVSTQQVSTQSSCASAVNMACGRTP